MKLDDFTADERAVIARLDLARLPRHIAVIMDGNGRWAARQQLPRVIGHRAGVESVRSLIESCIHLDIPYVTLYSFSTENWSRPADEVHALMGLIEQQMRMEMEDLHQRGVRVRHLGRTTGLPESLQRVLSDAESTTAGNTAMTVQFAINYSGRTELLDAVQTIARAARDGRIDPDAVTEADVASALYHPDVPDPDLLIRTAGEMRVSNYLLWQIAYSEFWVTPDFWPDFRAGHLLQALLDFQQRSRKFGGVSS